MVFSIHVAINFCHNWLLHINFCPGRKGGGVIFGVDPEGRPFVYKRFLPFLNFHCYRKNWR